MMKKKKKDGYAPALAGAEDVRARRQCPHQ